MHQVWARNLCQALNIKNLHLCFARSLWRRFYYYSCIFYRQRIWVSESKQWNGSSNLCSPPGCPFIYAWAPEDFALFFFFWSKCFYLKQIVALSKSLHSKLTEHNRGKHDLAGQCQYVNILSICYDWGHLIHKQSFLDKILTPKY